MESTAEQLGLLLDELIGFAEGATHQRVIDLAARLREGDLRVALVGEAKRGKSTLGNALLGTEVLPTGVVPVTAISTEVGAGSPARAEVVFTDGHSLCVEIDGVGDYVSEKWNPHNERGVSKVRIYLPASLPHPRLVLVDSPGIGSVHQHNTEEARQAFSTMDAAVLVLTADAPMSASELALLGEVTAYAVRVFVVLNKADQLDASERAEAEAFVSQVVAEVVGTPPRVFVCSAREAMRARSDGDDDRWWASGVPAFATELLDYLVAHRESALRRSIAGSAARVADSMLDATTVALAAVQAVQSAQQNKLADLGHAVDRVTERRVEAVALVHERLRALRSELDADAADEVHRTTRTVMSALAARLAEPTSLSADALEEAGRELIGDLTRASVEQWRGRWQEGLDEVAVTLVARSQQILTEAAGELYAEVLEVLGVRLRSQVPVVASFGLAPLRYEFGGEVGWNQPAAAWLRTHAPRRLGRRRTRALLMAEAPGLVDKHVGRARAHLQERIDEASRRLTSIVTTSFVELTANLEAGQRMVREIGVRTELENETDADRLRSRRTALEHISAQLRADALESCNDDMTDDMTDDVTDDDERTGVPVLRREV